MARQLPLSDPHKGIARGNRNEHRREIREAAEKTMKQIADEEARSVRERLASAYDGNTPVTVLMFQPVITPGQHAGRLVDVGPRPAGAANQTVEQNASSGLTGKFFEHKDTPFRWVPKSDLINASIVDAYVTSNTDEKARRDQVALEGLRYGHEVSFERPDAPPVDAFIHQQSLLPRPETSFPRRPLRYPSVGIIYTISKSSKPNEMQVQLPLFASAAADATLEMRLLALLGEKRQKIAADLMHRSDLVEKGEAYRIVGTLMLAHHWFYPHDPIAWTVLWLLKEASGVAAYPEGDKESKGKPLDVCGRCITDVYARHMAIPPLHTNPSSCTLSLWSLRSRGNKWSLRSLRRMSRLRRHEHHSSGQKRRCRKKHCLDSSV
jgi:hypothetical protein